MSYYTTTIKTEQQEIANLVTRARAEGTPDSFAGKRRWPRYQWGMRLEISRTGATMPCRFDALMHNISGGGFGFWSKQALTEGEQIYVRRWSGEDEAEWLPVHVTHCTTGIQGFLIGARFDHPCPPGELAGVRDDGADARNGSKPKDGETSWSREQARLLENVEGQTLSGRFAGTAAAAALLGTLTVVFLANLFQDSRWQTHVTLAGTALMAAFCGFLGRITARRDTRFLRTFRLAIHRMAKGASMTSSLKKASSRELNALREGFLDLSSRWRRREDDERIQRRKLEELTQLKSNILSIVSHDLRTPLTSILLYTEMLKEEMDSLQQDDQRHFLGIISSECNRLSRLVDDLLQVQRLESDRMRWDMKPQDLSDTIHACARVFEAMARSKSIDFTVECPITLPPAQADADKISQVISNLLSNAMKFTPPGGRVKLSVEPRHHEILIRVADSGSGIPRDKWDQLFDRFSQLGDPNVTDIEGFGLGLYIVKRIVECHGGAAWLDSEVGKGSEFSVSLPTEAARSASGRDHTAPPTAGRVLICDPDPQLGAILAQTLRWADFETRVCHSGARLIAQLAAGDIDVVITDLLLPDMNARELLHALNHFPNRSFSVVVHSYAVDDDTLHLEGVDAVLHRPVQKEELVEAVRNNIHHPYGRRLAILTVPGAGVDTTRLTRLLTDAKHIVSNVESMEDAVQWIHLHDVDLVLVPEEKLGHRWSELEEITAAVDQPPRIMVLTRAETKRQRRLAEEQDVLLQTCEPGREVMLLNAVTALKPIATAEITR